MRLTLLGVNGPFPAAGGGTSAYCIEAAGEKLQFDFGSGALGALTALCPPEQLTALLMTHWHFDHCADLLPLTYRLQAAAACLSVFGPEDAASPVRAVMAADPSVALTAVAPGDCLSFGGVHVRVYQARHPVPSVMYRVEAEGRTLCYTGDTNTVDGLVTFAQGADLLLADGLFTRTLWDEKKPHLSAALCAEAAKEAHVRRLVLTHLNPLIDPALLLAEAREIFPDTELAVKGQVYTV